MDLDNLAESQFLKALDALYERGGADKYEGLKFDPRGCREYQAVLDLARAALTPPEGYVLVPVEPTWAMREAGGAVWSDDGYPTGIYSAMIRARPEVP